MLSSFTPEVVTLDSIKHKLTAALHGVFKELEGNPSHAHVKPPILIDRAWIGMEIMKCLPQSAYLLERDTFAMAAAELTAMDDPFDAFHPTLSDLNVNCDSLVTCPLLTISRELRDIIYGELIATGHVKLAQVSKVLALAFTESIRRRGTCRLAIDETEPEWPPPYLRLRKPISDTIQHLDLQLTTNLFDDEMWYTPDLRMSKIFGDSKIPRKSCHVLIQDRFVGSGTQPLYFGYRNPKPGSTKYLRPLRSLGGFENVTVKAKSKYDSCRRPLSGWQLEYKVRLQHSMHLALERFLRRSLGSCKLRNKGDHATTHLEFRPRAFLEAWV